MAATRFPGCRDTPVKREAWKTRRKLIHKKARGHGFMGTALFCLPGEGLVEVQYFVDEVHWKNFQSDLGGKELLTDLRQNWKGWILFEGELPATAQFLEGDVYPMPPALQPGLDESAQPGMVV